MKNLDKFLSLLNADMDGLLLTSRYARHYAAEFDIAEGMAVVSANGCRYFTDSRYIESAQANISGFEVLQMDMQNPYEKRINEAIADFAITKLGVEEAYLSASEWLSFGEKLSCPIVCANKQIHRFRAVKEAWELEIMRKAQQIADCAFAKVLDKICVGMTEKQLQAELIGLLYKEGAEGLSFDPIVVSGPNTSLPHGVAGERKICEGDFITMDFGVIYQGYCSDMTRTVAVGYVTDEMKKVYDTVLQAQLAGIATTKAGVTGSQIDGAARKVIADAGYGKFFGHGYGHSLGLEVHEWPSCSPSSQAVMEENMILSAEPGIYLPGKFGVRIEDVVIIQPDGCENITFSPKKLIII